MPPGHPKTSRKIAAGYGRWLTWLGTRELLDTGDVPAARITPERVRDFIIDLRLVNAPYTVLARVQELYQAIRVDGAGARLGMASPH